MSTEILMPALSPTMTEGNLSKWLIKKGDIVKAEILKKKIATKQDIEKINKETLEEIKNAAEFANNSSFPQDSELYTDVYL